MKSALPFLVMAAFLVAVHVHATVELSWTNVGNPGNSADHNGLGSVSYTYQISRYEVTNAQYTEFLNAKESTSVLGLYNTGMATSAHGGILRTGSSGSYSYTVKSGYENKPVVFVSLLDAMRFSNWLHNGQGSSSTESGSYDLSQNVYTLAHSISATVWVPTENEWYKAAYYQPAASGGDYDSYWSYATASNDGPFSAPNSLGTGPTANYYSNDGLANGHDGGFAVTQSTTLVPGTNYLTDVGHYHDSASFFATFDQTGNVLEWSETIIDRGFTWDRLTLGGSWYYDYSAAIAGSHSLSAGWESEQDSIGFRLARVVPEPSRAMLCTLALGALVLIRRRPT